MHRHAESFLIQARQRLRSRRAMQDLTMLFYTVVFFSAAFLYVKACEKLR
jgi:hypothetical protein